MNDISDAARLLAASGASRGGRARAANLSPEERSRIARVAANARWKNRGNAAPGARRPREYAAVTPEVKAWMDAEPKVGAMLARLCARADRDEMLGKIEKMHG